jgi:hypothetical protein
MIGDFTHAVTEAIDESLGAQESMATQILSNEKRLKDFIELLSYC